MTSDGSNKKKQSKRCGARKNDYFYDIKVTRWTPRVIFYEVLHSYNKLPLFDQKGIYLDFYLTSSKFLVLLCFKSHFLFCDLRKRQILLSAVLSYMRQFPKERADVDICQHILVMVLSSTFLRLSSYDTQSGTKVPRKSNRTPRN